MAPAASLTSLSFSSCLSFFFLLSHRGSNYFLYPFFLPVDSLFVSLSWSPLYLSRDRGYDSWIVARSFLPSSSSFSLSKDSFLLFLRLDLSLVLPESRLQGNATRSNLLFQSIPLEYSITRSVFLSPFCLYTLKFWILFRQDSQKIENFKFQRRRIFEFSREARNQRLRKRAHNV